MDIKIFQTLEYINNRLANIEHNIARIDEKLEFSLCLQRNHLIRVKNGELIDDSMILYAKPYNDLSPQQAYEVFKNQNMNFIILDVTESTYNNTNKIREAIHIPLDQIPTRYVEIQNKTTPILVISEKGVRSILACESLIKKGYFNVNNISGGYEFWPDAKIPDYPLEEQSA